MSSRIETMKKLPQIKRLEYWKYQCAALSFIRAKEVVDYLISNKNSTLKYQLLTSVYVLYGRSFKQRKQVRMPEDIVPPEYKDVHGFLLDLRDKMFAHVDTDGLPKKGISQLSKILIHVEDGYAKAGMASLLPIGFQYERTSKLCQFLYDTCNRKSEEILMDAMDGDYPPPGDYEVNLYKKDGAHLIIKATFPGYKS
jgi:hypothetical protein